MKGTIILIKGKSIQEEPHLVRETLLIDDIGYAARNAQLTSDITYSVAQRNQQLVVYVTDIYRNQAFRVIPKISVITRND